MMLFSVSRLINLSPKTQTNQFSKQMGTPRLHAVTGVGNKSFEKGCHLLSSDFLLGGTHLVGKY